MHRLIAVCEKSRQTDIAELAQAAGFDIAEFWEEEGLANRELPQDCAFCVALKDAKKREKAVNLLRKKNAKFASLIHPSCEISRFANIGEGAVIKPFCMVSANAQVGEFCVIESHSQIGHNANVGAFSNIGSHCDITGFCRIGSFCEIEDASSFVPNVKIGCGVRVRANSAVIKSARNFEDIGGIPARKTAKSE